MSFILIWLSLKSLASPKVFWYIFQTLSSVWCYIKAPPAKSVLATICCGLSLIGMLLEYYCTLGGIVQVSLHCYPIRPSGDNRTRPAGGRNLNWARGASCTRLHCVAGEKTWHRERIVDFRDFLLGWKSICCCCNISTGSPCSALASQDPCCPSQTSAPETYLSLAPLQTHIPDFDIEGIQIQLLIYIRKHVERM